MGFRKALRPRMELLESKTVMSAGVAAGAGAAALSLDTPAAAKLARAAEQTVSLTGSADGDYTSTLSKHSMGIKYRSQRVRYAHADRLGSRQRVVPHPGNKGRPGFRKPHDRRFAGNFDTPVDAGDAGAFRPAPTTLLTRVGRSED